jgi:hypothetical protein
MHSNYKEMVSEILSRGIFTLRMSCSIKRTSQAAL